MLANSFDIVIVRHKYFEILCSGTCKIKRGNLKKQFLATPWLLRVVQNKLNMKETIVVSGYVTETISVSSK